MNSPSPSLNLRLRPNVRAVYLAVSSLFLASGLTSVAQAQQEGTLAEVKVTASADASAEGLTPSYAGGQVARGGRVGFLGNQDIMDTPFSTTAYTSELIQDQQARGVADVLLNDATVRSARGFGNFQELYMIRGFPVPSDDMTYNGLYGMLPRQYLAAELMERVEVLRGANAFLNGGVGSVGNGAGFGMGGAVNVLPKRAGRDPLTQLTVGAENGGHALIATDIARRFGADQSTGIRINAARRDGESAIKSEDREISLLTVGADYRSRDVRLSADVGYQDFNFKSPRPSVTPSGGIPDVPSASTNYAQPWTYSKERSVFATARAEFDLSDVTTAWLAVGMRNGDEDNRLSNPTATASGSTTARRADNVRQDQVRTGDAGVRTRFSTGSVQHTVALTASTYQLQSRNAYAWSGAGTVVNDLYNPTTVAMPTGTTTSGGSMSAPGVTQRFETSSLGVVDTVSMAQDRVRVTLGLRHQQLRDRGYAYGTEVQNSDYDKSRVTPMAGVVYKIRPAVSLYANYIEGLSKGETAGSTNNSLPVTNAGQSLQPYVARQTEVGAKYDGQGLGAGMTLFSTSKPFGMYDSSNTFVDGGEQRNQGLEFSLFGQAARGVRLLGGLTLLDAKIMSSNTASQIGKRAIGVPAHQFNLGADVDVPGVTGLALNARVIHTGGQYVNADNTLSIPAWTRLDLGVRYVTRLDKQAVTFRARLDNVTDRAYWASAGGYPGSTYLVQGAPRTLTVSATIDF